MAISKKTIEFNIELLFGEIGAIVSAPICSHIASLLTTSKDIISAVAVISAIVGAALFYVGLRVYHKTRQDIYSKNHLAIDLAYFTPVAFIITCFTYYPVLFFLSQFLFQFYSVVVSVLISQILAFTSFLIVINIYRLVLIKYHGKVL